MGARNLVTDEENSSASVGVPIAVLSSFRALATEISTTFKETPKEKASIGHFRPKA